MTPITGMDDNMDSCSENLFCFESVQFKIQRSTTDDMLLPLTCVHSNMIFNLQYGQGTEAIRVVGWGCQIAALMSPGYQGLHAPP